ncbi:MAG: hypothetical protein LHW56_01700 [Candidatus Cloacimonetes bacterium]|nr:hypothetical protein [Candidatus Cloacimonadota bacterium]MDY0171602.1 hypothetical protein [Candidatus Cloacimonadaceae bacterium]
MATPVSIDPEHLYRITGDGYVVRPLLLRRDSTLYFFGLKKVSEDADYGQLVYRELTLTDEAMLPLMEEFPYDYYIYYSEPYILVGSERVLSETSLKVSEPFYLVDDTQVFIASTSDSGIQVGKYDFTSQHYYTQQISPTGHTPAVLKNLSDGGHYLFFLDLDEKNEESLFFSVNLSEDVWSPPAKATKTQERGPWSRPIRFIK